MQRAVNALDIKPDHALIDGNHAPALDCRVTTIIKGDDKEDAIAAASIIAKVRRDREMLELHRQFPDYGFDRHKGYPTKLHLQALQKHGVSQHHRRSFRPVKKLLVNC